MSAKDTSIKRFYLLRYQICLNSFTKNIKYRIYSRKSRSAFKLKWKNKSQKWSKIKNFKSFLNLLSNLKHSNIWQKPKKVFWQNFVQHFFDLYAIKYDNQSLCKNLRLWKKNYPLAFARAVPVWLWESRQRFGNRQQQQTGENWRKNERQLL
jgi:hypothetical protein